jgi:hypothetical protein
MSFCPRQPAATGDHRILADGSEQSCNALRQEEVAKSTMTHHWRVLRTSGVIWQRLRGGRI